MREPAEPALPATRTEVLPGVWLDSRLALWLAAERLLVIADLHWGYAASHRARGNLLPAWGDDDIQRRLDELVRDYTPAEMIWLGDVVHAAEGAGKAEAYLRNVSVPTLVLAGNHDRRWSGAIETAATRGRFFLHHGDVERLVPSDRTEVIGHHHPALAWSDGAGGRMKLPALVVAANRLVLPAFSPWAAGADSTPLAPPGATVWAIAPHRIFATRDRALLSAAV